MKRPLVCALFAMLLVPLVSSAESSQNEWAGRWFLNPSTQNWTCSVFPGKPAIGAGSGVGKCQSTTTASLGYVAAFPLKQWNGTADKYYFYVQEWGAAQGPGSECWGDSILLFEVPYTADGARAIGVNPIYRGIINPGSWCSASSAERSHFAFHSVFRDEGFGGTYILGQRVKHNGAGFKEIWVGESLPFSEADEGKDFTWAKLTETTIANHDVFGIFAVPDASGLVWRGYLYNSHLGGFGATPIIIDWGQFNIRYKTSPTQWTTIPMYGTITVLPYLEHPGFVTGFSYVGGRYELRIDSYPAPGPTRPLPTCPDVPYLANVNTLGRGANGTQPTYVVVDANFNVVQTVRNQTSSMHPIPTNEKPSITETRRVDILAGNLGAAVYYGSNDWGVCNVALNNWGFWSGSGIRFGRVVNVP